ncbi:MAG: hypothetical protein A3B74_03470 [Candidatus Kerfeldbacteria bacterium RIFCSPHIGHO2_02_FULL_42_14]|uniref:Uncharacterized protein n=1 Tax=Candidatus Kerfeldbacteria bacterium RIFCSPHIGHO2_02_FULL_42_14 TaxID=1798540 RepID=A0A1G2ASB9_9BACT|nr:MAG: hypothetical protein A3B74_03470 [Candidatus Kerfeldbacteria bacterium RIFCSPHIGHO2_02_FULL_42_14]OGY82070.1 MAG: hypothetical protein A3E60_00220 [Candidatus Kerfeldbacteria bacterium RIFCSPHIGHO2_12_FULL_42_13]OGY84453.1 MAG: hypothetical protein A3I91_00025 [Candidatus Kerfeldbacteria bacterium RIFCSPLOWO2_02_FULL_42_19]OGY86447.1 MAG: hypothetical protein A3G01_00120 [Candidatus Kerfeldbacteria bacterium RIFCSPLOWO2_12_FULL_43_9]
MPSIKQICKITGKTFKVSEFEQSLRAKFDAPLPEVHPSERIRYLMTFRNLYTLYNDKCDLCGKSTLSVWGDHPSFPVYCKECWYSDKWTPKEIDLDLERPFFDQLKELIEKNPHPALAVADPMQNSKYCNGASQLKNCYMCFNVTSCEDCYYVYEAFENRNCIDTVLTDKGELLYECVGCHQSYEVFWSQFAIKCSESYFLYDCVDCNHCALSTGLRHKQYVFLNQQLTREQYFEKIRDLESGSWRTLQAYLQRYQKLIAQYPKKYIIGNRNENISGNIISNSKNIERGFRVESCENCMNIVDLYSAKDSLDVVAFGLNIEQVYSSQAIGLDTMNVKYSSSCYSNCFNLEYCMFVVSSHDCFGCAFARKKEWSILNRQYSEKVYTEQVKILKAKMKERGEYHQMFRSDIIPFAYNETVAQLYLPLTQSEARSRGFRWIEKKIPKVPSEKIFTPKDSIKDTEWKDIEGKVIICEKSKRPFKLIEEEFEFYKRFNIPLPRLHPEVRLFNRYPRDLMLQFHEASCDSCKAPLQTSMKDADRVLCERCYQKRVQ